MSRVLVMAAHADDEVLGAGGTVAKHVHRGDEVHVCIVTSGYTPDWSAEVLAAKKEEALEAGRVLGVARVHFLGLPAVKLDTIPQKELNEALGACLGEIKPQVVYTTHWGDVNMDHTILFQATLVAIRPRPGNSITRALCYETLSSTDWAAPFAQNAFMPNWYIDISATLELKLKAMSAYQSELKAYPHPRSLETISALARFRGSTIGVAAAEAFMLIRGIWQ